MPSSNPRVPNSHVFISRLLLEQTTGTIHVICPFHVDTDPSMSIDLDRGVFFCHGGCDAPKGGDAATFIIKWTWKTEQRKITRKDAQATLVVAIKHRDGAEHRRQMYEMEVRCFYRSVGFPLADVYRDLYEEVHDPAPTYYPSEVFLDYLALLYAERTRVENYLAIVANVRPTTPLTDDAIAFFEECKAVGVWSRAIYADAENAERRNSNAFREQFAERIYARHYQSKESSCPDPDGPLPPTTHRRALLDLPPHPPVSPTPLKVSRPASPPRQVATGPGPQTPLIPPRPKQPRVVVVVGGKRTT